MKLKLVGFFNIEVENTDWVRENDYYLLGYNIHFTKDSVSLPPVDSDSQLFEILKKAKGTWEIISTNPDTVFFNVPNNPLHGKYAIRFFIDEKGYWGNSLIYKIELQNDSTYLICNNGNTVFSKKSVRDWVSKN
jgi:hypothetical protein